MSKVTTDFHSDLISLCRINDRNAQLKIYNLYYKAMFNTCCRIINDETTAEDIMQESFLSAFRSINNYSGEVTFGAWLKRIVINRSIDHLKKRKLEVVNLGDRFDQIEEDDYNDYQPEYDVDKIKKAINELADGYRVVLSLYLLEGYDHEEIGQILEISPSTSRSQFSRAKQKLLEILN